MYPINRKVVPKCTLSKQIVIEEETDSADKVGFFATVFLDTSFKQLLNRKWCSVIGAPSFYRLNEITRLSAETCWRSFLFIRQGESVCYK